MNIFRVLILVVSVVNGFKIVLKNGQNKITQHDMKSDDMRQVLRLLKLGSIGIKLCKRRYNWRPLF